MKARKNVLPAPGWHNHLAKQLKQGESPVAVLTANGTLAVGVSEVCGMADSGIPNEVAVFGIKDDRLLPRTVQRPITAGEPDFGEPVYQGAAWLDRLMHGGKPPPGRPVRSAGAVDGITFLPS